MHHLVAGTANCAADALMNYEDDLLIDLADRAPRSCHPRVIWMSMRMMSYTNLWSPMIAPPFFEVE